MSDQDTESSNLWPLISLTASNYDRPKKKLFILFYYLFLKASLPPKLFSYHLILLYTFYTDTSMYKHIGSARGVMIIVIGNVPSDLSSNLG